jgi:hypothetical protein
MPKIRMPFIRERITTSRGDETYSWSTPKQAKAGSFTETKGAIGRYSLDVAYQSSSIVVRPQDSRVRKSWFLLRLHVCAVTS